MEHVHLSRVKLTGYTGCVGGILETHNFTIALRVGMNFNPTVCGAFSSLALENLEKLQKSCLGFKWGGGSSRVHSRRSP